mgnify:CR=1 FL=1
MKKITLYLLLLACANLLLAQEKLPPRFKLASSLQEVSGLYRAATDSLWWHNDSGDTPRLFVSDRCGQIKQELTLSNARNQDWEDITADDAGNIYIGDFGNNANARQNLKIYRYHPASAKLDSILFQYPDQRQFPPPGKQANFDMEGFFWHQDSLHLFSKNRIGAGNYFTKHYVIAAQPGKQKVHLRDSIYLKNRVVTAAAISPDRQAVALLTYHYKKVLGFIPGTPTTVYVLRNFEDNHFLQGTLYQQKVVDFMRPTQYESLDFVDNRSIYIASEQVRFLKPKVKLLKLKTRKWTKKVATP